MRSAGVCCILYHCIWDIETLVKEHENLRSRPIPDYNVISNPGSNLNLKPR